MRNKNKINQTNGTRRRHGLCWIENTAEDNWQKERSNNNGIASLQLTSICLPTIQWDVERKQLNYLVFFPSSWAYSFIWNASVSYLGTPSAICVPVWVCVRLVVMLIPILSASICLCFIQFHFTSPCIFLGFVRIIIRIGSNRNAASYTEVTPTTWVKCGQTCHKDVENEKKKNEIGIFFICRRSLNWLTRKKKMKWISASHSTHPSEKVRKMYLIRCNQCCVRLLLWVCRFSPNIKRRIE